MNTPTPTVTLFEQAVVNLLRTVIKEPRMYGMLMANRDFRVVAAHLGRIDPDYKQELNVQSFADIAEVDMYAKSMFRMLQEQRNEIAAERVALEVERKALETERTRFAAFERLFNSFKA